MTSTPYLASLLLMLAACGTGLPEPEGRNAEVFAARQSQIAPPDAPPGTCWGLYATPAVIETVTHQILAQPAEVAMDGTVLRPPTYKTETRQEIVTPRHETWFETPCAKVISHEFVASLQRALAARGHFFGSVNGEMDARTQAAVRRYQAKRGLDSAILSLTTARELGLIAVPRAPA